MYPLDMLHLPLRMYAQQLPVAVGGAHVELLQCHQILETMGSFGHLESPRVAAGAKPGYYNSLHGKGAARASGTGNPGN